MLRKRKPLLVYIVSKEIPFSGCLLVTVMFFNKQVISRYNSYRGVRTNCCWHTSARYHDHIMPLAQSVASPIALSFWKPTKLHFFEVVEFSAVFELFLFVFKLSHNSENSRDNSEFTSHAKNISMEFYCVFLEHTRWNLFYWLFLELGLILLVGLFLYH